MPTDNADTTTPIYDSLTKTRALIEDDLRRAVFSAQRMVATGSTHPDDPHCMKHAEINDLLDELGTL
jgi:hypothetical protein